MYQIRWSQTCRSVTFSLQQLTFLLYLPMIAKTVLFNDTGTTTKITSDEITHLAQYLDCHFFLPVVVTLEQKQYQHKHES